ncbi:putative F-box/kelch-repeat protein At3g17570 isoform X3 [Spinacia oleracea]|uniref:F-box/kelch-repeat protein At3g17570 isoform X3 n=1 Tax=Spinacia oleracea TaxID=3562 RepID=A0ABM3RBM1_SPIOL|nr:putative F-box/kelch-repeat protein At3g17570 isoform X3 [Spinacia oleracea]
MDLSLLNNDISFNVLSRLPASILVQLKLVSKGWQHLISNPDFMRLQMKIAKPILISGYLFQEKYLYCEIDVEKVSYIPIRAKETRIYQNVLEFLPEKVTVLGSSNGLICCRSCLPSPDPLIYICNPASKKWVHVKWDRINMKDYIAFSFEPSSTSTLNPRTDYKLVRVFEVDVHTPGKEEFYFTFEIYNWERRVWVKSKEICHCEDSLCINQKVSVKVISQEGILIWSLEECFSSNWDLRSFISFEVMEQENTQYLCNLAERVSTSVGEKVPWMEPLAFKDGKLFLRVSNSAYSFDIQTRKICFLCEMLDLGHEFAGPTVIPYSVTMANP